MGALGSDVPNAYGSYRGYVGDIYKGCIGIHGGYVGVIYYVEVSLNYCSQNGGNVYRPPYYHGNPNIGPRIIGNLDQYPCMLYPVDPKI